MTSATITTAPVSITSASAPRRKIRWTKPSRTSANGVSSCSTARLPPAGIRGRRRYLLLRDVRFSGQDLDRSRLHRNQGRVTVAASGQHEDGYPTSQIGPRRGKDSRRRWSDNRLVGGQGVSRDREVERLEVMDGAARDRLPVAHGEVILAEVVVGGAIPEQTLDDHEDRVGDRDGGFRAAAARSQRRDSGAPR